MQNKNLVRVISLGLLALMKALDNKESKPVEGALKTFRKVDRVQRNIKSLNKLIG